MIRELSIKITPDGVFVVAIGGQADEKGAIVKPVQGQSKISLGRELFGLIITAMSEWGQFVDQMTDEEYTTLLSSPLPKKVVERIELLKDII